MKHVFRNASLVTVNQGYIELLSNNILHKFENASIVSIVDGSIVIDVNCPFKEGEFLNVTVPGVGIRTVILKDFKDNYTKINVYATETNSSVAINVAWGINSLSDCSLAPMSDIIRLQASMRAKGFEWYPETKQVLDYSNWKPKNEECFYYVNSIGEVKRFTNKGYCAKQLCNIGNCFKFKEQALTYAEGFKDMLKR